MQHGASLPWHGLRLVSTYLRVCQPIVPARSLHAQYTRCGVARYRRPLGILIGGAKVADKIGIIGTLIQKVAEALDCSPTVKLPARDVWHIPLLDC
jgi:hypothetical protein